MAVWGYLVFDSLQKKQEVVTEDTGLGVKLAYVWTSALKHMEHGTQNN